MATQPIGSTMASDAPSQELKITQQLKHIKLVNTSEKRIAFAVSTELKKATTTPTGVLDPNESALLIVKCDGKELNDRVTLIYTNLPEGTEKQYKSEYFQREDGFVVRRNLPIRYEKISDVLVKFEKC